MLATSFVAALSASLAAATLPSLVTAIPALYTSQPPLVTTQPPVITTLPPIVSLNSAGLPTTLTTSTKATPSPSPSDSSRSKSSSSDEHSTTSSTTRSTKSSSSSSSSSSPSSTRSTTSSTSSSSSSTSSDPTASAGAIPGASNAPAPSGPVPGPASPTNQGPNSASANPSQSSSAAPTPQSSGNHLTGSAIAGISAGSVSGALIVGVAALFLVRRFGRKNAPQEQIYPEEAYLYDPPTTHVIMKPPPVPPAYQIPPMGSYTPFGSNPNLAPAPASDLPRGSFESVDLSAPNPAFVSQGGYAPVGAGDTNSMGGVSAHDWAAENAARTLNPIPAATIAAGAGAGLGIAGAAAYAYRPSEEFDEAHDPAPSISAVGSLPSPVYRVLEEHSQEPRPLHPLERDLGIGRQASVSTLTSEEEQMEENSPLMERTNTQNQHFRPIDELWTGADGYQRVETEDV
ncbi:MAG: hypothetical protein M1820_002284 [Bogoriella megaspora]|nr:MAG: hypothetical protein M1820_002284 [Bogoriella megaspora]